MLKKIKFFDLILFFALITIVNFIYCYLYIKKFPLIVDENNKYILSNLGFNYSELMQNFLEKGEYKATYFDVDFYVSRMPLIPLVLKFLYLYISKNFFLIHLIKNLFLSFIIFFILKKIFKKKFLFYISLIFTFFLIPHNVWTTFSFNFEEGLLNYFLIILFLMMIQDNKKNNMIVISIILSLVFLLKSSMIFLVFAIVFYFFIKFLFEKNFFYLLPLLLILISNVTWGIYSLNKTGFFAFGTKSVSYNAFVLNHAYNNKFNKIYPDISPDTLTTEIENMLPKDKKKFKNEWEINNFYFQESISFIKNNPSEVLISLFKKIYVLFLYPYKDAQWPDETGKVENKLRFSNIPNKICLWLALFILFLNIKSYSNLSLNQKKLIIVYSVFFIFYLFPYMVGFIYTRHCVFIYMLSFLFLFVSLEYNLKKPKILNYFIINVSKFSSKL